MKTVLYAMRASLASFRSCQYAIAHLMQERRAGKQAASRGRQKHLLLLLVLLLPAITGLVVMCIRLKSSEAERALVLPPSATVWSWRTTEEGQGRLMQPHARRFLPLPGPLPRFWRLALCLTEEPL